MTIPEAVTLRGRLNALLSKYQEQPRFPNEPLAAIQSEILGVIDPHREFFRPYLTAELETLVATATDAVEVYFDQRTDAERHMRQIPGIRRLQAQQDNFADGTRDIIADATKAVALLDTFIAG